MVSTKIATGCPTRSTLRRLAVHCYGRVRRPPLPHILRSYKGLHRTRIGNGCNCPRPAQTRRYSWRTGRPSALHPLERGPPAAGHRLRAAGWPTSSVVAATRWLCFDGTERFVCYAADIDLRRGGPYEDALRAHGRVGRRECGAHPGGVPALIAPVIGRCGRTPRQGSTDRARSAARIDSARARWALPPRGRCRCAPGSRRAPHRPRMR